MYGRKQPIVFNLLVTSVEIAEFFLSFKRTIGALTDFNESSSILDTSAYPTMKRSSFARMLRLCLKKSSSKQTMKAHSSDFSVQTRPGKSTGNDVSNERTSHFWSINGCQ